MSEKLTRLGGDFNGSNNSCDCKHFFLNLGPTVHNALSSCKIGLIVQKINDIEEENNICAEM